LNRLLHLLLLNWLLHLLLRRFLRLLLTSRLSRFLALAATHIALLLVLVFVLVALRLRLRDHHVGMAFGRGNGRADSKTRGDNADDHEQFELHRLSLSSRLDAPFQGACFKVNFTSLPLFVGGAAAAGRN